MKHFSFKICIAIALLFTACNTIDVFEKTAAIPHHEWSSNDSLFFTFTATDSLAYYNIYLVLRHTESYHFNNIWIDFTSSVPNKKPQTQRLNLLLANANGWLGSSMDDIIEQRVLLFSHPTRLTKGAYTFSLQQVMREDPLQNILNAGIRVEKAVQ
ncbi:MAG: gliding motility lipoprotein GldH [Parafilimonas sp.]